MGKYHITIEEVISEEFEIEAEDEKDAIEKGIARYKNGEIVLEPGNVESRKISVNTSNRWIEF